MPVSFPVRANDVTLLHPGPYFSDSLFFHLQIMVRRDNMDIRRPMSDGLVSDWDAVEQLWQVRGFIEFR